MQSNLHRVSEFAVMSKETTDVGNIQAEKRSAFKRLREHESDSESDIDDVVRNANAPMSLPDLKGQSVSDSDLWNGSMKSEVAETDTTVLFSFDWENEEPYEKAVERYNCPFLLP